MTPSELQGTTKWGNSNSTLVYKYITDLTEQKKEMEGVSFQKTSTETFSFTLYMLRNYTKSQVPMTFHQRLLQNWQNLWDISQLQLIPWIRWTSHLSTFSAVKHPRPAAGFPRAPWAHPPPQESTPAPPTCQEVAVTGHCVLCHVNGPTVHPVILTAACG